MDSQFYTGPYCLHLSLLVACNRMYVANSITFSNDKSVCLLKSAFGKHFGAYAYIRPVGLISHGHLDVCNGTTGRMLHVCMVLVRVSTHFKTNH